MRGRDDALQWTVDLPVLAASVLALFRKAFERHAVTMISAHKIFGPAALGLALARLAWPRPPAVRLAPPPGR